MDLLDFEGSALYYDTPPRAETVELLRRAGEAYGEGGAGELLQQAAALEPDHFEVLVALYRYHYYRHDYEAALQVGERAAELSAQQLGLPQGWAALDEIPLGAESAGAMPLARFFLMALKGAAYLELRLGRHDQALERLRRLIRVDSGDRLGVAALLQVAEHSLAERDDAD